jgi:hypothetical protein
MNENHSEEHQAIMEKLEKIEDALIGTYEKKGLISRIATLEKYMGVIGVISMTAITGVVGRVVVLMMN